MLAERTGSFADIVAHEFGGLEHHICGIIFDFGVQAAHDAGKCNGLFAVADDQICGIQCKFLFIERDDLFAVLRSAHNDLLTGKIAQIKGMHGLTDLLQHIVCDIDDIGDRTDADQCQTAAHPCGRFADLNIADIMCRIARAEIRRFDRDLEAVQLCAVGLVIDCRHFQRLAQCGRDLACDAEHGHAVRAVRGDRNIEHPVIQPDNRLDIRADRGILRQHEQTAVFRAGIQILIQTDLDAGAEHAVRFKALELALFDFHETLDGHMILCSRIDLCADQCSGVFAACLDIIGAAADLKAAVFAAVYLTHREMRVGNRLQRFDLSDHDAGNIRAQLGQCLDLKAAVKELCFKLLRRNININVFL